jgi:hypothetical protein
MRDPLTVSALLALAGCNPPIDINVAPTIALVSPAEASRVDEGEALDLVVTVGDADEDPLVIIATSSADGEIGSVEAGDGDTVTVQVTTLTPGEHVITLQVTDDVDLASVQAYVVVNGRPSVPELGVSPLDPRTDDDLLAEIVQASIDPDGAIMLYAFMWTVDTSASWVAGPTLDASATTKGETWTVTATATEGDGAGAPDPDGISVETSVSVVIGNTPPTLPDSVAIRPAAPLLIDDLACEVTGAAVDADDDLVSYTYAWVQWVSGVPVATAHDDAVLSSVYLTAGDVWTCEATSADDEGQGGTTSSAMVTLPDATLSVSDDASAFVTLVGEPGMSFGTTAAAIPLDHVAGDDLVVGATGFSDVDSAGAVAAFRGGGLGDGDFDDRTALLEGRVDASFGAPLMAIGDLDGDGMRDLLVSAMGTADSVFDPTVYVIGSGQVKTLNLTAPYAGVMIEDAAGNADFGVALAGGDVDMDGLADVFVGDAAPGETGRVYLFTAETLDGAEANAACQDPANACVTTSDAAAEIHGSVDEPGFGTVISSGHDIDGDGLDDLLVTAPDTEMTSFGWLFLGADLDGALLAADAHITFAHDDVQAEAGREAVLLDDLNGDGLDEMLISAPVAVRDATLTSPGLVAILYGRHSPDLTLTLGTANCLLYGRQDAGRFGERVVAVGDLGFDGRTELAIAAPDEDSEGGAHDAGVVHVFAGALFGDASCQSLDADDAALHVQGEAADDRLSVGGGAGDLDLDGAVDLILTSEAHGGDLAGAVYILLSGVGE